MITVTPAADVSDTQREEALAWSSVWDSKTHPHEPADSGKFHFDYADHFQEQVYILEGTAVLTPDDDAKHPITITAGDFVIFHQGFSCDWHVKVPMRKRFCYFDEDGTEISGNVKIACDECSEDCWENSYFIDDMDICLACFEANTTKFAGAEEQQHGVAVQKKKVKKKKRTSPSKGTIEREVDDRSTKNARS